MRAAITQWKRPAQEMPDADQTVIIHTPGESDPVWLGFHDGETWRTIELDRVSVEHWRDLPAPPARPAKKGARK